MTRVWAEINLQNLIYNAKLLKQRLEGAALMAVIKADAYGHGAVRVAKALESVLDGRDFLAVASVAEAFELRDSSITLPILILGYTPAEYVPELIARDITQTVYEMEYAHELSKWAGDLNLNVHLKVDTGMNRLGIRTEPEARYILGMKGLRVSGMFTHLASADTPNDMYTKNQLARFKKFRENLGDIKITHCANSGAVLYYKGSYCEMARSGLLLFGASAPEFKPVMTLKARIAQVKIVPPGERISYDGTYRAERVMQIAVVCAGYADGYMRSLSGCGVAVCGGERVPVVGRVCMDMLMLDVSAVPTAQRGDTVTLFGSGGPAVRELAGLAGTIPYELLCAVSRRVPRIYV
ncbi:alanine racemase [Clostridia bacterium]|nr:alanine racemase [Clostridia bacterium]